ncbi:MAG: DUF342 domain-containing protein [bacterium]|nr:DUF342 domain-containing protein [bacterium]
MTVAGGVIDDESAWIRAAGDAIIHLSPGATIECKETLTIQQSAVNIDLRARAIVGEAESTRILGGTARAEEQIIVGEAGSDLGATTTLAVAYPLEWEHDGVESKWKGIVPVKEQEADAITAKLTRSVACAAKELLKTAQIDVIGNLHLGVVIEIGELSLTVERTIRGVRFRQGIEDDRPFIEEVSLRDLAELWRSRQGPPRHGRILSETRSTWRPRSAPASDSRVTAASLV